MEEFVNLSGFGSSTTLDDRKTTEILQKVKDDLKNNRVGTSTQSAIVSGRFWRSIYQTMSSSDSTQGIMWSCVDILDEAARTPKTRDFLVNSMLFVPLIGELMLNINKRQEKKRQKMLVLLERLTENYTKTVNEFAFARIIKHLLHFVQSEGDRSLATLSLSILINLCKKNRNAAHHLVHQINVPQFTVTLNEFDVLGVRMNLILAHHASNENVSQTNIFLWIASQLTDIKNKNIGYLTSLVHEAQEKHPIGQADSEELYNNIQPSIEKIINHLEETMTKLPSSMYSLEQILGLIDALLLVSSKSFLSYYDRLMNVATHVVDKHPDEYVAAVALNTIRACISHQPSVASMFCDKCVDLVRRLFTKLQSEQWQSCTTTFVGLFQLLDSFVLVAPATALNLVAADAFDGLWAPLVDQQLNPFDLEVDALRMHLYAMQLLVRCTEQDPDNGARSNVIAELMSRPHIHYMLSRANNSGVAEMQSLVFRIARSPYFPVKEVSKICSVLHRHPPSRSDEEPYTALRASCCMLKEPANARLNQLLHNVQTNIDMGSKTSSTHILEMYTFKLLDCEQREKTLQQSLEQSLKTIATITQDRAMQSLEFDRYNSYVLDSDIQSERLRVTCEELRKEADTSHTSNQQLHAKLQAKLQKDLRDRRDFEQRLAISAAEVNNYKQQIETAQRKVDTEAKRFAREAKELQNTIDRLMQSISKLETSVADHEKDKVRLNAELVTKEAQIKKMEATVSQKQSEIEEEQALRDQILSLMAKKK